MGYARGNLFANVENAIRWEPIENRIAIAMESIGEIHEFLENDELLLKIVFTATGIGFEGTVMNAKEKEFVRTLFSEIWNGDIDGILECVSDATTEVGFEIAEMITEGMPPIAMSYLRLILAFAYADDEMSDELASRLENTFGIALMGDFFASGLEEVPPQQMRVQLTQLEHDILEWYVSHKEMKPLAEICSHFSGYSRDEVKEALESLVEKNILFGGEQIFGCMYALVDDSIEIN